MPSVSSEDGGLEDRDEDFFEQSEKESEKLGEVRNLSAPVCSVPKVASGSNLASVRLLFFSDIPFSNFNLPDFSVFLNEQIFVKHYGQSYNKLF